MTQFFALAISLLFLLPEPAASSEKEEPLPTLIVKVDGDALVRRKSRIEESAGVGGRIYAGDTVITGARSTVEIMTTDGSLVKVGFNSRFQIEESSMLDRAVAWTFLLVHGQVRALVVKKPDNKVHFRVRTPSAAVGVRGTEFVLVHNEGAASTYLFNLEGLLEYGVSGCERSKSCVEVRMGETSVVKKGSPPSRPAPFNLSDLLVRKGKPSEAAERLSLFLPASKAAQGAISAPGAPENEASLKAMVDSSSEEMNSAQDRAIGRTKAEREAVNAAMKDGSFRSILEGADRFTKARLSGKVGNTGGAEEIVAPAMMMKFRMGLAMRRAESEELFMPGKGGEAPDYTLRKTVAYEKTESLKTIGRSLESSVMDYTRTMAPVRSSAGSSVSSYDRAGTGIAIATSRNANSTQVNLASQAGTAPTAVRVITCSTACASAVAVAVVNQIAPSIVAAYNGKTMDQVEANAVAVTVPVKASADKIVEPVKGNVCYETQQINCKLQLCTGFAKGAVCRKGESVKTCETKRVAVPCR